MLPRARNLTPRLSGVVWMGLLLVSPAVHAQNFAIDWFKIAGGGGTSTGGVYALSGTIGQPDAGVLSGGSYTLVGGFWGVLAAIQVEGAPRLSVRLTGTNIVWVAWPASSATFQLQENADLNTTNWVNVATPPVTAGGQKQVPVSPPRGNRFYRLKKL
jgi:hypothetical protein